MRNFALLENLKNELQTSQRVFFLKIFARNVGERKKLSLPHSPCDPTCFETLVSYLSCSQTWLNPPMGGCQWDCIAKWKKNNCAVVILIYFYKCNLAFKGYPIIQSKVPLMFCPS